MSKTQYMNYKMLIIGSLFIGMLSCQSPIEQQKIDLSGKWQFSIDSLDKGVLEKWYQKNLKDSIELPGSMKENVKGEIPTLKTAWTGTIYDSSFYYNPRFEKYRQTGNIKFPFWLTPNRYYKGAAWYRKAITIPDEWKGQRIILFLERPHWQTSVWLDNHPVGSKNSLSTPHVFDLTKDATSGSHFITIRIDNRLNKINVGPDSHSVTDHTQGNWNGIVGNLFLKDEPSVYLDNIQLYPNIRSQMVRVVISLRNETKQKNNHVRLFLKAVSKNGKDRLLSKSITFSGKDTLLTLEYTMGKNVRYWDEFHPNLYRMDVGIETADGVHCTRSVSFGMRQFEVKDGHFEINGRPVFLRGTVECCTFPLTGYPPTDTTAWGRVFRICRKSGVNHIRFHSWCPPEAAFTVADKMGLYLQPEAPTWPNHGSSLGNGRPVDQYVLEETARIFKSYGNHPSFVMWSFGNEPSGRYVTFLDHALKRWEKKDPRRVYTGASTGMSWSVIPESQYLVRSGPRGLPFDYRPNSTFNYAEKIAGEPRAYVTHEMGQWCVFPDFNEISEFTGVYRAKNFELFREDLADHHMAGQAHDFLMASGKLQVLCYKAEIEAALRTPGLDGFQLLGLNDFPGQGTALVGMLDVFWNNKGYVTPEEISHFCNQTVPLAEFNKFVFSNDETLTATLRIAHYGNVPLKNVHPFYFIVTEEGDTLQYKRLKVMSIPIGNRLKMGKICCSLSPVLKATKCKLEVHVGKFCNSWEFWVYPHQLSPIKKDEVYYSHQLDSSTMKILKQGGKVFLDVSGRVENGKDILAYFTPVFWNTSWFKMRPPHTLGILVQNDHPAFADFPTEYHSNYQWWGIINNQQVMCIDSFPVDFKPLVQPIDTWFLNRRLAQLFEASVGKGKLMVSSLNLDEHSNPASKQLRYSIIKYMNSSQFNPKKELSVNVIRELFEKKDRREINFYTREDPDELKPNHKKNNIK